MTKTQEIARTFPLSKTFEWAIFAILISGIPLLLHEQWIVGPIVNAILVAVTLRIGFTQAMTLAVLPSAAALAAGTLPFVLAPTIPVIILGNVLLITGVRFFRSNPVFGVLLGAVIKFMWLIIASQWILQFFLPEAILGKVTMMLSWPQLATALIGGYFALSILKLIKR